jgi:hypothetical protein
MYVRPCPSPPVNHRPLSGLVDVEGTSDVEMEDGARRDELLWQRGA